MKDIWLIKKANGTYIPSNDSDHETSQRIPVGEETCFTLKKIRNPKFHRRYFSLIKLAFENQEHYKDQYVFRKVMEMRAGYFHVVMTEMTEKQTELYIPKSISYSELDQTDFEQLYDKVYIEIEKCLNLVSEEDREMFQSELAQYA